jgi:hypothetical protein
MKRSSGILFAPSSDEEANCKRKTNWRRFAMGNKQTVFSEEQLEDYAVSICVASCVASMGRIHQNCLSSLRANCLTSSALKSCSNSNLCLVGARQDLTALIFGIHQSLCCNCQKVCSQTIYFRSDLLTHASKRCLNNCFIPCVAIIV